MTTKTPGFGPALGLTIGLALAVGLAAAAGGCRGREAAGDGGGGGGRGRGGATAAPGSGSAGGAAVEVHEEAIQTEVSSADEALAARVRAKLAADPQVGQAVELDAESGRVTLWGKVASPEARAEAERLAKETPGVTGVKNLVRVEGGRAGAGAGH
jgi:hypothetical protein